MKIKILSDLHLEFSPIDIVNNGADVLILSGDIMLAHELHSHPTIPNIYDADPTKELGHRQVNVQDYRTFLTDVSSRFKHVIYVAGNHEFYGGAWNGTLTWLRTECANYPNIHFLESSSVVIDDVVFIGGTLWTDANKNDPITMQVLTTEMNDYTHIRCEPDYRKLSPIFTIGRHFGTVKYFEESLAAIKETSPEAKVVVVTHHAPTPKSIHPKYQDSYYLNGGYSSDLSNMILNHPEIALWTHGHIHYASDYFIGSTRIICNPRGYQRGQHYKEATNWDPNLIIEI